MSITNYTELKAAISDFLNRDDLDSTVSQFISLAEAQINRDIRHYSMENRATADTQGRFMAKPNDWVETIRMHTTGNEGETLDLVSMATMADNRSKHDDEAGRPKQYCHSQNEFEVWPTPDDVYTVELLYYQKIPALSDSVATNWLLDNHPDVYLYGALQHTAPYLQEDSRINTWAALYSAAVQRVNTESTNAKFSGTGLRIKIRGLG